MHQLKGKKGIAKQSCFDNALNILKIRDHSVFELETKLAKKGFSKNEIKDAVEKCIEYKFIDDAKFAASLVKSHKNRLSGPLKIKFELKRKKISEEIIEDLLSLYEGEEELLIAEKYFLKVKYKFEKKETPQKRAQAFMQNMAQRGFSKYSVYSILEKYSSFFKSENYF